MQTRSFVIANNAWTTFKPTLSERKEYVLFDGVLIFDDIKYRDKINPVPIEPQRTLEDYVLDLEFRLALLEIGGL